MVKQTSRKGKKDNPTAKAPRRSLASMELWKNKALYLMCLPALAWVIIFNYVPMYGVQIAFRNYNAIDGITGSPWVGLKNFMFFFKSNDALRVTGNTLLINALCIILGHGLSIATAILLNEIGKKKLKKVYQTLLFFPYFISWAVVQAILQGFLSDSYGLVNNFLQAIGQETVSWYSKGFAWVWIIVACSVWKGLGYNTVIYLARITSVDEAMYEAARLDGANKWQEIKYITLPMMKPTVIILLLMSIGSVFRADLNMFLALAPGSGPSMHYTNVIDTYVYYAMKNNMQYGLSAAVGLWQSVMGLILVLMSNWLVRKYDPDNKLF